ncbi:MAG: chaperone modulator CbpM [Syntrophobacterales bacterium]|nr:chaperone modulator CbpM [Syntrophobacterales bacterium]
MTLYLVKCMESKLYLKAEDVASQCGLHPELIDRFVYLGLIDPLCQDPVDGSWLFEESVVPIIKKIVRLRNELGINYAGIGVVLDLLTRLDSLEERVRILEEKLARLMNDWNVSS